jgi:L-alanine-DL-glutamate epimerase-like enolase superfamily enzyme
MNAIDVVTAGAYTVPCETPESDGTFQWDSTTVVVAEVSAGGHRGLGYTYGPAVLGGLIAGTLGDAVRGRDAFDLGGAWSAMVAAIRNMGPWGLAMYAVSAVDVALWDLKARLLDVSLAQLLGRRREHVEVYGSGGFCSYSDERLQAQLGGWAAEGFSRVKMKVGRDPGADPRRVAAARDAIGPDVELMVDANGAWSAEQAVAMAERFAASGIGWLEEPVSSDDLAGLRHVRERVPTGVSVAAGEYATDGYGFARLLEADAVDVLQADVTRCGGVTGLLQAGALAAAHNVDVSAHCAPNLAAHPMAAIGRARHIEYFHDHARIETMLFDGTLEPRQGRLTPDPGRTGHGLELRRADAAAFAV